MAKIIAKNSELWTLRTLQSLVGLETEFFKKQLRYIQDKIERFERRYGNTDRDSLYGQVDDMELVEWEGEIETLKRLERKLPLTRSINERNK